MRLRPCPSCKRPAPARDENPAFPFCSPRCRTIDLGAWIDERYRVEAEPARDEEFLSTDGAN